MRCPRSCSGGTESRTGDASRKTLPNSTAPTLDTTSSLDVRRSRLVGGHPRAGRQFLRVHVREHRVDRAAGAGRLMDAPSYRRGRQQCGLLRAHNTRQRLTRTLALRFRNFVGGPEPEACHARLPKQNRVAREQRLRIRELVLCEPHTLDRAIAQLGLASTAVPATPVLRRPATTPTVASRRIRATSTPERWAAEST